MWTKFEHARNERRITLTFKMRVFLRLRLHSLTIRYGMINPHFLNKRLVRKEKKNVIFRLSSDATCYDVCVVNSCGVFTLEDSETDIEEVDYMMDLMVNGPCLLPRCRRSVMGPTTVISVLSN